MTDCINWQGPVKPGHGYGYVFRNGNNQHAHRAVYEILVAPIPAGMHVDHLCRNRLCVNPAHMELVTLVENVMRGESPMARNARKTHCAHGHEFNEFNTLLVKRPGAGRLKRRCRTCENERRGYKVTGRHRSS